MNRQELFLSSAKAAVAAAVGGVEVARSANSVVAVAVGGTAALTPAAKAEAARLITPAEAQTTKRRTSSC